MQGDLLYLYGGDQPWDSVLWVTSDDRVRGGASQSYLSVLNPEKARFHGHLDTKTLGGAGFASQHSLGELDWDLSEYEGIVVTVVGATDGKRYALTLKDTLLPPRRDGRERSSISWEAEFVASGPGDVRLSWKDFKPSYRGRDKPDAAPLDLTGIKRVGLMMRSFFGKQDGDFALEMHSIAAWKSLSDGAAVAGENMGRVSESERTVVNEDEEEYEENLKARIPVAWPQSKPSRSWLRSLTCGLF